MSPQAPHPESELTDTDVSTCIQVLKSIEADRSLLTRLTQADRRELLTFAGLVAKPEKHALVKMAKAFRRAERETAKQQDREVIAQTALRVQRRAPIYAPLWIAPSEADAPGERPELNRELSCYVCKKPFVRLHRYYDSLCEACGDFNYSKRTQTADLTGHYALITGARVKIGFNASLKLLRAGAHVVVTTRFPVDAAGRYAQEPDFPSFSDRLQIHGLDLRHTPSVEIFSRFLLERLPRLDYILNNACQTVRRPPGFFQHLIDREEQSLGGLPDSLRRVLLNHDELKQAIHASPGHGEQQLVTAAHPTPADGLVHSAALSQRRYLDEDFKDGADLFPLGRYDEDQQQVDLREINSWRLRLHEVATAELLEVQLVNAIAPYILNARLKPLMLRTPGHHKHIVNVSAMEGQFYRATKTDKHPHTNMAKAALNMMTRTSAADFVKDGIHMNAVDTGWVTDEDPAVHAARKAELGFAPPLDIIDGAARIVDPIFVGRLTGTHLWGQFLKDYKPTPW